MMHNIPRFLVSGMTTVLISLCAMTTVYAATVHPEEAGDNATEETGSNWDAAKDSSAEAWEKTKEASSDVWEATKETSADLWDDTKEFSSDAWDATKEGSAKVWDSTREWVNGTEESSTDEATTGY